MIYVALAEFLLILALLVLSYGLMLALSNRFGEERDKWTQERRDLLERIQRPERVPVTEAQQITLPDVEPNEWAKVGQILDISDTYGLTDDDG